MTMQNRLQICLVLLVFVTVPALASAQSLGSKSSRSKPRVVVLGVNGAEWDFLLPLVLRGEMPNLARMMDRGVSGKLRTIPKPNCPKVYSVLETGLPPQENGITGFLVDGQPATTEMLKAPPLWKRLSTNGITVGMANVPATFPVQSVNGYMISGMLTRGTNCEDGLLCSPLMSQVRGGDAVYPKSLAIEIETRIGDVPLDCARMPGEKDLSGHEETVVRDWLDQVAHIREQQRRLFSYLLEKHPMDFTFLAQSCEDRVGHWLYPIQPHNVGYNPKVHTLAVKAFPDQYRAMDQVLGTILDHVDDHTFVIFLSDHGIKPLRERTPSFDHHDHGGTTPIIANHDFEDGDDVPGVFVVVGPNIRKGARILGLEMSVFDIAPTILHLYGIQPDEHMVGRVLTEIFEKDIQPEPR
jgi:predicted AlkP superfamily phosphohydrolase/phosphomutase